VSRMCSPSAAPTAALPARTIGVLVATIAVRRAGPSARTDTETAAATPVPISWSGPASSVQAPTSIPLPGRTEG
jgi:hypothetical protein